MHICEYCGRGYTSKLIAEDCADQDRDEQDDREHGRFYGVNRSSD